MSHNRKFNHLLEDTKKIGKSWQEIKRERLHKEKKTLQSFCPILRNNGRGREGARKRRGRGSSYEALLATTT
jgi:hypothetical protein